MHSVGKIFQHYRYGRVSSKEPHPTSSVRVRATAMGRCVAFTSYLLTNVLINVHGIILRLKLLKQSLIHKMFSNNMVKSLVFFPRCSQQ